ncbi:hypothetical protein [Acidiphilium sp.]|uniref:hypothetical protein n=1 Tax=Acidiphilium sp. TaxID=527 RepID=UPI003D02EB19
MPDSPVEKHGPSDYPLEMETRVAILEHMAARSEKDFGELKAMVRDLTNTVLAKFDATDKAIADLRVEVQSVRTDLTGSIQSVRTELHTEVQSVRTELQTGLNSNLRWTVGSILGFGTLGLAIIGLLLKLH